jgi:hypothetical protein
MRKTFKYRLYPTKTQEESLRMQLSEACRLYNAAPVFSGRRSHCIQCSEGKGQVARPLQEPNSGPGKAHRSAEHHRPAHMRVHPVSAVRRHRSRSLAPAVAVQIV